jgi:hypothetical protein
MLALSQASLPNVADATLPQTYERAKTALATCDQIDECKDWADKAAALASYAKQADDDTLHRLATRISARAVRRCGELLQQFDARGGDQTKKAEGRPFGRRQMAAQAGMSAHQEKQAVRVANVPAVDFEAHVEAEHPPTVTRLAELGKTARAAPPGFAHATHAIGRLKELATFCGNHEPNAIALGIYPYEVSKVREHVQVIQTWLEGLAAALPKEAECKRSTRTTS